MEEPRWLDDVQQHHWRAYVDGNLLLWERLERDLKVRHGLSIAEYEILVRLSEPPDRRLRMAELAVSTSQSRSRLSHTVSRLEISGLVVRESCHDDGRGVFAVLTDEGFARLDRAARDHVTTVRELFIDVVSPTDLAAVGRSFRLVMERAQPTAQ